LNLAAEMLNKMNINVVVHFILVSFEYFHLWTPCRLQSSAETCSCNKRVCCCAYQRYLLTSHSEQCTTHTHTHTQQHGPKKLRSHTTEQTTTMYFNRLF